MLEAIFDIFNSFADQRPSQKNKVLATIPVDYSGVTVHPSTSTQNTLKNQKQALKQLQERGQVSEAMSRAYP